MAKTYEPRNWHVFVTALLMVLLVACCGGSAEGQKYDPIGILRDDVRTQLAAKWDDRDAKQHEMAYCLLYKQGQKMRDGRPVYEVYWAKEAIINQNSTSDSEVAFTCPTDHAKMTFLHTHPPTSCYDDGSCQIGGLGAWQCFPSTFDQDAADDSGDPFTVIQCDRNAFIFVWSRKYRRHGPLGAAGAASARPRWPLAVTPIAIAASNRLLRFDRDSGGYRDQWLSKDKWGEHFPGGYLVTTSLIAARVRPSVAVLSGCATGLAWEWGQSVDHGKFSGMDAVWTCGGSLTAGAAMWLISKW